MEKNKRYARLRVSGKDRLVHRLVYEWFIGAIPDGLCVCHHCDNTKCVRPSHLFTGTVQDNNMDRCNKGRSANGSRNGNAKLNELQVQLIRQDNRPYRDIANSYGITRAMISHIRCGKFWRKDLASTENGVS